MFFQPSIVILNLKAKTVFVDKTVAQPELFSVEVQFIDSIARSIKKFPRFNLASI